MPLKGGDPLGRPTPTPTQDQAQDLKAATDLAGWQPWGAPRGHGSREGMGEGRGGEGGGDSAATTGEAASHTKAS